MPATCHTLTLSLSRTQSRTAPQPVLTSVASLGFLQPYQTSVLDLPRKLVVIKVDFVLTNMLSSYSYIGRTEASPFHSPPVQRGNTFSDATGLAKSVESAIVSLSSLHHIGGTNIGILRAVGLRRCIRKDYSAVG